MEPSPTSDRLNQARQLYATVQMLQRRVLRRHGHAGAGRDGGPACGELTMPQLHMMIAVGRFGSPSLKELAHALQVSAPSASTMVDRLVEMRMLTREPSQVDRREVVVTLSTEGRSMAARMEEEILESLGEILEKLGPEYAELWCRVFAQIRTVLADEDDSGRVTEQTNE